MKIVTTPVIPMQFDVECLIEECSGTLSVNNISEGARQRLYGDSYPHHCNQCNAGYVVSLPLPHVMYLTREQMPQKEALFTQKVVVKRLNEDS